MREAFLHSLASLGIEPGGARVLAAYSGGADSTALTVLLAEEGFHVTAAHLHHGMRPEADEERDRCAEFCQQLGIEFVAGKADVPEMARRLGIGIEEAGREARYHFLRQAARQTGCVWIATGHTRDDHVETVLMHLVRGSGLTGLAGIPRERDGIIRPLLDARRTETRAFCEERGCWFHDDPANQDVSFSRARIRLRVLPELEAINPQAAEAISRLADTARGEDSLLNGMAAGALERAEIPLNGQLRFLTLDCEVAFSAGELRRLPRPLLARALRLAAGALGGEWEHAHIALIIAGLADLGSGSATSPAGEVAAVWTEERLTITQTRPTTPFRFALTAPGETVSEEFGWQFTARSTAGTDPRRVPGSLDVVLSQSGVQGQLHFRTAQESDRIRPLHGESERKIADILNGMKLTRAAKARLPIVCDMVGPVWVPGGPIADRVKVVEPSAAQIHLTFGPAQDSPES